MPVTQDNPHAEKKTTAKPTKAAKAARVPLGRYRTILDVQGKDPDYYYRWVKDTNDNGSRIQEFKRAGFEMVTADEVVVGEEKVDRSTQDGGLVRLQYGGETLYLMKQPNEYREEDVKLFHGDVDETEQQIFNPQIAPEHEDLYGPAQYGEIKTTRR